MEDIKMAKRFYAVQHGNDNACDFGSTVKREARKMATELHKEYPEDEIRVIYCTTEDNFCDQEVIIYPAKGDTETEFSLNWGRCNEWHWV